MQKVLFIDPIGGVAGDMLCAALLDSGQEHDLWKRTWRETLQSLPWKEQIEIQMSKVMRGVFAATHLQFHDARFHGGSETQNTNESQQKDHTEVHHGTSYSYVPHNRHYGHQHSHHGHQHSHHTHTHDHHSHTPHTPKNIHPHHPYGSGPQPVSWSEHQRGFTDIQTLLLESGLPKTVVDKSIQVFRVLGEAEASIHGSTLEDVHFHEVGAVDSILDIVGFCLALDLLGIEKILVGALPLSSGEIHTAHGRTPLPAPATLRILQGWPCKEGYPNHEQVTPTGAALVKALGTPSPLPSMTILSDGYGAGTRNPTGYPNLTRIVIGSLELESKQTPQETNPPPSHASLHTDTVLEIQATIDDMSAELLAPLIDTLLQHGALDATLSPVWMKKGRMGYTCTILCKENNRAQVLKALFTHSTTFGCRFTKKDRAILHRTWDTVQTSWGSIQVKVGIWESEVMQCSVEFEEAHRIAQQQGCPLVEIYAHVLSAHRRQFPERYPTSKPDVQ